MTPQQHLLQTEVKVYSSSVCGAGVNSKVGWPWHTYTTITLLLQEEELVHEKKDSSM